MPQKILVSECLYGDRVVRYDGGSVPLLDPVFLKWKEEGRLVPVCPEMFGGLPTPRPAAQRKGGSVFTRAGVDVTEAYRNGAEETLRIARMENVRFCILKANSPSCGSKEIHDGTFSGRKVAGAGLAAELLKDAGFIIFDEYDIAAAAAFLDVAEGAET
jgi:uncharacterized protein YbbK (DUF523 family)